MVYAQELPEKYQKLAGIDIEKKMQLKREEAAAMAAKEKEDNLVLLAGHVCWAKATGFPWYPSLVRTFVHVLGKCEGLLTSMCVHVCV